MCIFYKRGRCFCTVKKASILAELPGNSAVRHETNGVKG